MKKWTRNITITACLVLFVIASTAIAAPPKQGPENNRRKPGVIGGYGRGPLRKGPRAGMQQRGPHRPGGRQRPAFGPGSHMHQMAAGHAGFNELIPRMIKPKLNLTEEQSEKIEKAKKDQTQKIGELLIAEQKLKADLEDAVSKGDKEAIKSIAEKIGNNIAENALIRASSNEVVKDILNEKQMLIYNQFKEKRRQLNERMRERLENTQDSQGNQPPKPGMTPGQRGRRPGQFQGGRGMGRGPQGPGQGPQRRGAGRRNQPDNE